MTATVLTAVKFLLRFAKQFDHGQLRIMQAIAIPFLSSSAVCWPFRRPPTSSSAPRPAVRRAARRSARCRCSGAPARHGGRRHAGRTGPARRRDPVAPRRRRRERRVHLGRDRALPTTRRGGHRGPFHRRPDARLAADRHGRLARGRSASGGRRRRRRHAAVLGGAATIVHAQGAGHATPHSARWIVFAALAGAALPVQGAINAQLRADLDAPITAALWSFVVATAAMAAVFGVFAARGRAPAPGAAALRNVPWWGWLGGLCGATYVTSVFLLIPHIGVAPTVALTVAGQQASPRSSSIATAGCGCRAAPSRRPAWPASPSCSPASRSSRSRRRAATSAGTKRR